MYLAFFKTIWAVLLGTFVPLFRFLSLKPYLTYLGSPTRCMATYVAIKVISIESQLVEIHINIIFFNVYKRDNLKLVLKLSNIAHF